MTAPEKRTLGAIAAVVLSGVALYVVIDVVRHHHALTVTVAGFVVLLLLGAGWALAPGQVAKFLTAVGNTLLPFWKKPGGPAVLLAASLALTAPVHALAAQVIPLPDSARVDSTARDIVAVLRCEIVRQQAALDSIQARLDSMRTRRERYQRARRAAYRTEQLYVAGQAAAVALNFAVPIQRDPGGYRDQWLGYDKMVHANVAYMLTDAGIELGVRPWVAAGVTCAFGYAFEWSQAEGGGYVSNRDAVANCTGAASAVIARRLIRAVREGRGRWP